MMALVESYKSRREDFESLSFRKLCPSPAAVLDYNSAADYIPHEWRASSAAKLSASNTQTRPIITNDRKYTHNTHGVLTFLRSARDPVMFYCVWSRVFVEGSRLMLKLTTDKLWLHINSTRHSLRIYFIKMLN